MLPPAAAKRLVDEHTPMILDRARKAASRYPEHVREDLAQESWLRIGDYARGYEMGRGSFEVFTARRIKGAVQDSWRSMARQTRDQESLNFCGELVGDEQTPETSALVRDRDHIIRTAALRLPFRERQVILGIYFENKTGIELARYLGVSSSAVTKIKQRALDLMRPMVAELCSGDGQLCSVREVLGR